MVQLVLEHLTLLVHLMVLCFPGPQPLLRHQVRQGTLLVPVLQWIPLLQKLLEFLELLGVQVLQGTQAVLRHQGFQAVLMLLLFQ